MNRPDGVVDRTGKVRRKVLRTINAASAAEAVGPIVPGIEVYGLSKGQFSLVELLHHILDATGPADVVVSTWTAAGADLAHCRTLLDDGRIKSCRWLVDFSFPARQPAYCGQLVERFGADAVRATANHAKFVMVRNDDWHVVVRTSMNLNLNRRLESFEISDDPTLAGWLEEVVDAAFAGEAATVGEATAAAGKAAKTVQTLAGEVERRDPEMSFTGLTRGMSCD